MNGVQHAEKRTGGSTPSDLIVQKVPALVDFSRHADLNSVKECGDFRAQQLQANTTLRRPYLVVNASNAPHAAHVAVAVPAVNLPLVIQLDAPLQRLLRRLCPLQNLQGSE